MSGEHHHDLTVAYCYLSCIGDLNLGDNTQGKFSQTDIYREWANSYDKNGNIQHLDRHGKNLSEGTQAIDALSYHYNGNQLIAVDDAITYDNGNDFIGNFVYVNDAPAWLNFDEGRVIYHSNGTYFAETYLKDHLGNIRVAFSGIADAVSSTIRQVNAYYPFGMNIRGLSSNNRSIVVQRNEYQYNGKMYQDEMGLNWYDYGARFYDAALGRFHTQDRFAEKFINMLPYQYGANSPILFIDVNGDSLHVANNEDTHNDIKGLVNEKNQRYISFNEDGSVTLDFSGADAKTQKKALKDKGLQTINNLVESADADGNTENYYYEASNTREGVLNGEFFSISLDKNAGKETGLNDNSFVTNLSTTPLGVPAHPNVTPANGYNGSIYISPGTMYNKGADGNESAVPRSSLVRHELNESYNRTHKKMNYNQAHGSAGGIGTYTRFVYAPLKKK